MKNFNSDADVEEWMDENMGIDGLRRALDRGAFGGQNKTLATAWLQCYDRKQAEQVANHERSLLERSVAAAEKSSESAQKSARWAMWAALIALFAVAVTVLQSH